MARQIKTFTISIDIGDDEEILTNANVDVELIESIDSDTLEPLSCILANIIADKVKAELKTEDITVCH